MTDDEMRIVIAEKCGTDCEHVESFHPVTERGSSITTLLQCKKCGAVIEVQSEDWPTTPNYPNDLNAMHEAEKTLSDGQYIHYRDHLSEMAKVSGATGRWIADNLRIKHSATARQRAEAFIKTVCPEKWKGNE